MSWPTVEAPTAEDLHDERVLEIARQMSTSVARRISRRAWREATKGGN